MTLTPDECAKALREYEQYAELKSERDVFASTIAHIDRMSAALREIADGYTGGETSAEILRDIAIAALQERKI